MSNDLDESDSSADDSSTATEDEDAKLLTPAAERKWLRAYAAVKLGDPALYEKDVKFFDKDGEESEDEAKNEAVASKKSDAQTKKPITVKDHERQMLLGKGPTLDDGSGSEGEAEAKVHRSKGYFEEQEDLKRELLAAISNADAAGSGSGTNDEPLIKVRDRSESERKTNEFNDWMLNRRDSLSDATSERQLAPLRRFWNDSSLDEAERYLRDYLLEKRYLPAAGQRDELHTAQQREESSDEEVEQPPKPDTERESDRESNFSEKVEEFETKFNFRYQEPDATFMRRFPRTFASAANANASGSGETQQSGIVRRRAESTRARKRRERSEREALERRAARNQLNRERASQRTDLRKRLAAIRKVSGVSAATLEQVFGESDIDDETDFDPAKYEAKMHRVFGEDFYNELDQEKTPLHHDESENESESETATAAKERNKGEETKNDEKRKLKRFASEALRERKRFDETMQRLNARERSLEDGRSVSLPFRYREVAPCDFGLSVDEVLRARDKELNAWVSSLRMVQYRSAEEEARDRRRYASACLQSRKTRVIPSLLEPIAPANADAALPEGQKSKRKRKRPSKASNLADANVEEVDDEETEETQGADANGDRLEEVKRGEGEKGEKRKQRQPPQANHQHDTLSKEAQTGAAKKKRKRKHKSKHAAKQSELHANGNGKHAQEREAQPSSTPPNEQPAELESKRPAKRVRLATSSANASADGRTDKAKVEVAHAASKKRKRQAAARANDRPALSDSRLRAYGIDPKKYKYLPLDKARSFAPQHQPLSSSS